MPNKKNNQFGPTTGDIKSGAPGDEKPAQKLTKTGNVRKPRQPREVDRRIVDLIDKQSADMIALKETQKAGRQLLRASIAQEAIAAKAAAKRARLLAAMSDEEREQLRLALTATGNIHEQM